MLATSIFNRGYHFDIKKIFRVYDAKETWSIMHDDWCDIFQGRKTIEEIAKIYESHNVGKYNFTV